MSEEHRKLTKKLDQLAEIKLWVMPRALQTFVRNTPRRSGNARRNTRLNNQKDIVANYAYSQRLDEGWSRQSPEGMTKPTEKQIQKLVKDYIKRLGA